MKRGIIYIFPALALCLNLLALDYWTEREFFENSCLSCHAMKDYLWPRSYKAWELTIANMRGYVGDETLLNEEDGKRIAEFLTMYTGEGGLIVPEGEEKPDTALSASDSGLEARAETLVKSEPVILEKSSENSAVATGPEVVEKSAVSEPIPAPAVAVKPVAVTKEKSAVAVSAPQKLRMPLLKCLWNPGRTALKVARFTGFIGVASLLGLLLSGFNRRKLNAKFRVVHRQLALALFVALIVHAVIYIFEYGTPHVLWYWFGVIGSLVLITTQLQGKLRRRFRMGSLSWHIFLGCAGLAVSLLHWVWAWL